MSYIDIQNINFAYHPKRPILQNLSLSIDKGQWIAILGHNGSGKSTLAKAIIGLLEPDFGTIDIDGMTLSPTTVYEIRKKIGIVFQNPDNQFVGVTVRDDIAFGMENLGVPQAEMLEKIDFYAEKVGMKAFLDKEPAELSGGQKQRVAIAGILAMQMDAIIFDEATSMLDPTARRELMDYIRELHNEGLTIIMITHDIEEALWAQRLVIIKDGTVFRQGTREELLKEPVTFIEAGLELPVGLQISNALKQMNALSLELEEHLWESSLKK
ncbi:MAG: energy-coupling factor transporter ATPase [Candidatus Izemoplasmatales bacterium]|jgi:energy-coupling factor transport system ATP-binding protein|nr:energy-coupling factor transporter ATPase [Candidatus Izemoplasmatales bacterium]